MKKQRTRIAGGLIVAILMATISTVLVSAETENADETEDWHLSFNCNRDKFGHITLEDELTDEQQVEIDALITSLNEEGASNEEIRGAISSKLDELGILDERLDNTIEQTEQKLEFLNRENELRDQGYSWEEINEIMQEEYILNHPSDIYRGLNQEIYKNT